MTYSRSVGGYNRSSFNRDGFGSALYGRAEADTLTKGTVLKAGSLPVGMDIINYLHDSGHGALGTNLYLGYMPDKQNVVVVMETGGPGPYLDYGDDYNMIRPGFQVIVRESNYRVGIERAARIRTLLMSISNKRIYTSRYLYIRATGDVTYLGRKATAGGETNEFSVNFNTMREV